ncbi:MAG: hypothetical protein QOK40_2503 [Miltoncostaeaceae bacterium]|nr:hypothetical protein [Miltoncostaeaceae bacterium]
MLATPYSRSIGRQADGQLTAGVGVLLIPLFNGKVGCSRAGADPGGHLAVDAAVNWPPAILASQAPPPT